MNLLRSTFGYSLLQTEADLVGIEETWRRLGRSSRSWRASVLPHPAIWQHSLVNCCCLKNKLIAMKSFSDKPVGKTSRLNELIKLDRFLKLDESDIIDSATTGNSFIRRMNENSFNFSFSIRLNVPKKFEFTKTPCGEISEIALRFFTQSSLVTAYLSIWPHSSWLRTTTGRLCGIIPQYIPKVAIIETGTNFNFFWRGLNHFATESLIAPTNFIIERPHKLRYILIDIILIEESFIYTMSSIVAIAKRCQTLTFIV